MAYTLNLTSSPALLTVTDETLNTDYGVRFVGRNRGEWGEVVNENFLRLMENFAGIAPPPTSIEGQLFWETAIPEGRYTFANVTFISKVDLDGIFAVTFGIGTQSSAPPTRLTYTVTGNGNTSYNGGYMALASTTTTITLYYFSDPGTFDTGTPTTIKNITTVSKNLKVYDGSQYVPVISDIDGGFY